MNQREALLAGARQCLAEKGYGRTTARDIAAASGAHLASIGYHFGSKDRLMATAALAASSEWGDTVERAARDAGGADPAERLGALLGGLLAAIPDSRDLQAATLQALAQAPFDEQLRGEFAEGMARARAALAAVVLDVPSVERGSAAERGLGSLVSALVTGLVAQACVDPDSLPDTGTVLAAVRSIC